MSLKFINNVFCTQVALAEEQRDEALSRVQMLTEKFDQLNSQNGSSIPRGDLRGLSLQKLKGLQVNYVMIVVHVSSQ